MADSLGARLRRQREQQNIALATIAEQTKIKESLLDALERDDVSRWPSGIFRRAYIRAYAHAIGLAPDPIVREFLELYPDPQEDLAAIAMGPGGVQAPGGPPTRLRFLVGSAMASLARLRRAAEIDGPAGPEHVPGRARVEPHQHWTAEQPLRGPEHVAQQDGAADEVEQDIHPQFERHIEPDVEPHHEHRTGRGASPDARTNIERTALVEFARVTERDRGDDTPTAATSVSSGAAAAAARPDFTALANLCTRLGRVEDASQLQDLLHEAAGLLDATGVIVWLWDASAEGLRPALVCGYSDALVAQLPVVTRDADNATARAFRRAETCVITSSPHGNGALVIPLLVPAGCAGVLALELDHGGERREPVRAAAMILAALLAQLTGAAPDPRN